MAKSKRYYWLKLNTDFFRGKPIKKLRKLAGGDTYTIIYLKMLLSSLKDNGKLYFDGIEDDFVKELASDIDEDEENVRVTVRFLMSIGHLTMLSEEEYLLTECESMTGSECESASRMREHREREKLLKENKETSLCDECVTMSDTEIEKEIDKREEKEKKEEVPLPFNFESAFEQTFAIYPKKTAYTNAKTAWMDKLLGVIEENRPDIARLIYTATAMYLDDYRKKHSDDAEYKFIPKYAEWLKSDCDYWLKFAEKRE